MPQFKDNLQQAFLGDLTLESAEVVEYVPTVSESSEFTEDDMDDVLDERYAVGVALDFLPEVSRDCRQLAAATSVINVVGQAATAAETMPPAVAESFVSQANCIINDASKVLGVEITPLENEDDGSVSDASMESLGDWFDTAKKAFRASVGPFFGRIALTLGRLSDSSKGLANRCARVRAKISMRKGNGSKELNISSKYLEMLVLGDNYAVNPIMALNKFSELTLAIGEVVEEYHVRVDKLMRAKIFDALANVNGNAYVFSEIDVSDLRKQLEVLIGEPAPLLLGNVKYKFGINPQSSPLFVMLEEQLPSAEGLVKHLPAPKSLSSEDVIAWVSALESLIGGQMSALVRLSNNCTKSFQNVKAALEKVNYSNYEDKDEPQLYNVDTVALLRLETQVVNEIGTICDRLVRYQADLVARLDAALVVVEESLFQD